MDVTYNLLLETYMMTMRSHAGAGGISQFSIYEAPEPWGPWATVYYTPDGREWGESQHIPSKWISADGKTIYLIFSGNDSFSVRRAKLTVEKKTPRSTPKYPAAT
jgi:hypothetical protein